MKIMIDVNIVLDMIQNLPDFKHSPISAITPEEFVNTYVTRSNNN